MATRRGPDNTVRFSISGTVGTASWANVFWAQLTTSGTPVQSELDTWLTAAQAAYKTRFAPRQASQVAYSQAQALLFLPGGLTLPSLIAMTGTASGASNTLTPADVCAVVSWVTGVYWRGGKPRTYSPMPLSAGQTLNKILTTTEQANMVTAGNGFLADINALTAGAISGTHLGFVSFRSGNADRATPVFYSYLSSKCHPRLGTQRRRLGKWVP